DPLRNRMALPIVPEVAVCHSLAVNFGGDRGMPTRRFDVVILGGGNAGMGVTVATREAGLKVAMIEPDLLGGTCPNRGCMPKKVLVRRRTRSTRSSAPRHITSQS